MVGAVDGRHLATARQRQSRERGARGSQERSPRRSPRRRQEGPSRCRWRCRWRWRRRWRRRRRAAAEGGGGGADGAAGPGQSQGRAQPSTGPAIRRPAAAAGVTCAHTRPAASTRAAAAAARDVMPPPRHVMRDRRRSCDRRLAHAVARLPAHAHTSRGPGRRHHSLASPRSSRRRPTGPCVPSRPSALRFGGESGMILCAGGSTSAPPSARPLWLACGLRPLPPS